MRNLRGIDPMVLFMDLLSRPALKPVPLTPEQAERVAKDRARAEWNAAIERKKAEKKTKSRSASGRAQRTNNNGEGNGP